MLRSIKDLIGYQAFGREGKIGKVADVLFGDRNWRVRYLVLDLSQGFRFNLHYLSDETEKQTQPKLVLVEPSEIEQIHVGSHRRELSLDLNGDTLDKAPRLANHMSVEQQLEAEFARYFRHSIYEDRPLIEFSDDLHEVNYSPPVSAYEHEKDELEEHQSRIKDIAKQHVHSAKKVLGYHLKSQDETLGPISDFILDDQLWEIRFLAANTSLWHPTRRYLVDTSTIELLDWSNQTANTQLTVKEIESCDRYHPHDPINHPDEEHAYDYCGKDSRGGSFHLAES